MAFRQMDIVPHTNTDDMEPAKKPAKFNWEGPVIILILMIFLALAILLYVLDIPINAFWRFCRLLGVWISGIIAFSAFIVLCLRHAAKNWNRYQQDLREARDVLRHYSHDHDGSAKVPPTDHPGDGK